MENIKNIVDEIKKACANNEFKRAGKLALKGKTALKRFLKGCNVKELEYAYSICGLFNLTQEQCYQYSIN